MWYGSITVEQWKELVSIFAKFTPDGWTIPIWLMDLKEMIGKQNATT